jgi:hypothetical protein
MARFERKASLIAACAVVLLLGIAVGCKGFFVNPTLTSIAVGPTATIQQSKTLQMTATGTYSDGSTKPVTSGIFWSSASTNVATVGSTNGIVMGVSPGTSVITGAAGTVSGTATVTVTLSNITAIKVTPTNSSIASGSPVSFVATATANGQQVDVTNEVTWTVNVGSVVGVSIDSTTGVLSTTSGDTGTVTVTATDPTSGVSGSTNLTIN